MEPTTVTGTIGYWAGYLAIWALIVGLFFAGLFYLGRAIVRTLRRLLSRQH